MDQALLRKFDIIKFGEVFGDEFKSARALRLPRFPGETFKTLFSSAVEVDCEHKNNLELSLFTFKHLKAGVYKASRSFFNSFNFAFGSFLVRRGNLPPTWISSFWRANLVFAPSVSIVEMFLELAMIFSSVI